MMVAAVSGADPQNPKTGSRDENPRRPPLLPSERDNGVPVPRRPKSKQVSSRYMSPSSSSSTASSSISSASSTSRRCPSPLVSRNSGSVPSTPASAPKRSVSVDRRRATPSRQITPDLAGNAGIGMSAAAKLLVTSTRSLSVSFQGEAFSLPVSKTKAAPPTPNLGNVRKGTPERKRNSTPARGNGDQVENSKPIDQHRWPARSRQPNPLSRSLDCSQDGKKLVGSGNVVRPLQQSAIDESRRASFDGRLGLDFSNAELLKSIHHRLDGNSVNGNSLNESSVPSDLSASDTDSISSGSTSGVQECGGLARTRSAPRGMFVSARFWQETNSRLRRLQDPGSPLSTSPAKMMIPPKFAHPKKCDNLLSSPRTTSSPIRGAMRPASPSKLMTSMGSSPSRGMPSPSRVRNSVSGIINSNYIETPSVLSFAVDVRRGKVGENRIIEAHLLRLLYNRHLQWRFVNARTEAALLVQKRNAEITCLEDWASLDKDQSVSLLGAIEALKASTLRLPVVGGAIADIQSIKDAVGSAVDVAQAMASSVCSLLSKVEEVNFLVAELAKVIAKERALLEQCKDFLSALAALQVRDCSLKTHVLQLHSLPKA
ncbi:QWRF motif-containing protein 2-like isoform X2 [Diospyros lotus]|uniref:QWRF motif-containing protein 2-like isoform X2 n=1 Tax=Diospyros lotus TaxID=55363 RepID=UPI00224E1985|nr:QWRF motif-containing protein 2-like isoform X2 [Diospyros lotus]